MSADATSGSLDSATASDDHPRRRPEIQGLRAIAVGLVLLYHLWPQRLTGGFVGVDVFFVISGYLVGGALITEIVATGRVQLVSFWKRRARRLLPAALLTLALVAAAIVVLSPLSTQPAALSQIVSSALYVQNWALIDKSVDYQASGDAASPVQHYWSLSVEEQLYVALPIILVLLGLVVRRSTPARRRVVIVGAVGVAALVSLGWSMATTAGSPTVAYFSTFTRAWEFLVGALAAGLTVALSARTRWLLSALGLVAIAASAFVFDAATVFPGVWAAVPVGGAIAILVAHDAGPLARVCRWRPLPWVGDISYAVYLWHWPLIVLLPFATGHDLRTSEKLGIAVAAIALGALSTFGFENPVRFSSRLLGGRRRARTVLVVCGVATLLVVAGARIGTVGVDRQQQREYAASQQRLAQADLRCLGAAAMDPATKGCTYDGVLIPTPSAAPLDLGNRNECWATFGVSDLHVCGLGSTDPEAPRIFAVGDSHNNSLIAAYEKMGDERGWHVDVAGRAGCSWSSRPQGGATQAYADECWQWKQNVAAYLADQPAYDLILTTSDQSGFRAVPDAGETAGQATVDGYVQAFESQTARGTAVVAIRDHPVARGDVITCVERYGRDANRHCARPRDEAIPGFDPLYAAVKETRGTSAVDLRDYICTDTTCLTVIGDVVVYRNQDHLTKTFVTTLAPFLAARVQQAWDRASAELDPGT